jgi:hypothetical protein
MYCSYYSNTNDVIEGEMAARPWAIAGELGRTDARAGSV